MWAVAPPTLRSSLVSLLRPRPRPVVLRHFTTSGGGAAARVLSCSGDDSDRFLSWFRAKAGVVVSTNLAVGTSVHGRALVASHPIQAGESILKIPFSAHIHMDSFITEIKSLLADVIGDDEINSLLSDVIYDGSKLAFFLLMELKKGQDSEWAMYINNLPPVEELHNTIFWNEAELDMILPSTVYLDTLNYKANLEKDFLKIKSALVDFSKSFEDYHLENFMHAYALVVSRAWGSLKGPSLIPFADFMNHDGSSDSVLSSYEDIEISEVIADKDFIIGEEVFIRYGKFSNADLMMSFGFTVSYNTHDQVQICFAIDEHDPLCTMKVELLHKHHMPTEMISDNGLKSYGIIFTINQVTNVNGKGGGIPQSLRAFSRVLVTSEPEDLDEFAREAALNDGRLARHKLQDVSKEIAAHRLLLS